MRFLLRSLVILLALYGLVFAVGDAYLSHLNAPIWLAVVLAVAFVGLQYLGGPALINWVMSIHWSDQPENAFNIPAIHREFLAQLCATRGLKLPRLGLILSGTPNAFSFGHTPADSRIVITQGLLDTLTPAEVNAVLAHELGHIEHWDFVVMTIAALVPLLLYQMYVFGRNINHVRMVAYGAYMAYLVSQFVVLLLNRTREYFADAYACDVTGHGADLSSALVKIAIGLVTVDGAQRQPSGARAQRREHRLAGSMAVMGISNVNSGRALILGGNDAAATERVMRWELANPWARVYELNSTHPLTAHRVRALGMNASTTAQTFTSAVPATSGISRSAFLWEVALWAAPFAATFLLVFGDFFARTLARLGFVPPSWAAPGLLIVLGVTWLARIAYRYRGAFETADVASLLDDVTVSEMRPRAVRLTGTIVGRGVPGVFWSPDLVLRDSTGLMFLRYRQSIPFARLVFALAAADDFIDHSASVTGWYRRGVRPYVEIQSVTTASGPRTATYSRWVQAAVAAAIALGGWYWLTTLAH